MTEARALGMGQYSHNNQPCHHILYLFALLGDRETTEVNVRKVLNKAYGIDYLAGDEDNGEQSAWYILSAVGLYVTTPGTTEYVLGSPIFKHVRVSYPIPITTDTGSAVGTLSSSSLSERFYTLDITAPGTDEATIRVEYVVLNDNKVTSAVITHDNLLPSALYPSRTIQFVMQGHLPVPLSEQYTTTSNSISSSSSISDRTAGGVHLNRPKNTSSNTTYSSTNQPDTIDSLKLELKYNEIQIKEMQHRISLLLLKYKNNIKHNYISYVYIIYLIFLVCFCLILGLYYGYFHGGVPNAYSLVGVYSIWGTKKRANFKAEYHSV